jgi:hypothetical protein
MYLDVPSQLQTSSAEREINPASQLNRSYPWVHHQTLSNKDLSWYLNHGTMTSYDRFRTCEAASNLRVDGLIPGPMAR